MPKKNARKLPTEISPLPLDSEAGFPIVGIGASAGGLAAFETFFSSLPADALPGMAFVLIQHLAPDHKSILAEFIQRHTTLRVFEAKDQMRVLPNCIYTIPPNRDLTLQNGTLHLLNPIAPRSQHLPIDFFFRSLAQDQHERALCIILSGTGCDGTLGMREVKAEDGIVIAQSPESTEFNGMPRSAIDTGLVDCVLSPAEMPGQLQAYAQLAFGKLPPPGSRREHETTSLLKKICILVKTGTGHDFSHYKQTTLIRRIERRMTLLHIVQMEEYIDWLQQTPSEVEALFHDFLIGVTQFFRDSEAFDVLRDKAIPALFKDKPKGATIRVWVPGCSTGEEAYSIAILLHEEMERLKQYFTLQIFATDIDGRAVEQARSGVYPPNIAADLSHERLSRFFLQEPTSGLYRIRKDIRDLLIFSEQNLIKDPPFSRLDLISCRNLLIYLDGDLQKRVIPLFHYSLNPDGILFMGSAESAGNYGDLFTPLDPKIKIYQRNNIVKQPTARIPFLAQSPQIRLPAKAAAAIIPYRELTQESLILHYSQVAALIDETGDILYLHGRAGCYLEPSPGEPVMNILKMAREGLKQELTCVLQKTITSKEPTRRSGVQVKTNSHFTPVDLTVRPVTAPLEVTAGTDLFLVILEETQEAKPTPVEELATEQPGEEPNPRIAALKKELKAKEEYLQNTIEKLKHSNQELRASNKEMQSINEEQQSTNEEMQTTREELQSVNEELSTVNAELQNKLADLSRSNNDLNNLLAATGMGTLFVDHQQRIKRFTPAITELINLIEGDIGRPLGHIVSNLIGYNRLVEDTQEVLDTLVPKEIEVQTKSGRWYLLGIRPYRTLENVIEGAAITFVDIHRLKGEIKI